MPGNEITVHMVVKNEDRWIWYAITSVINEVSQIIIYDTGSVDHTIDIIKTFPRDKIIFSQKKIRNNYDITRLRQEQIDKTTTNWFMLLDGDEVWSTTAIKTLIKAINSQPDIHGIVVKSAICLGDIFHLQDEKAGKYNIAGTTGHYNIRAYRKDPKWKWTGEYPLEAYVDNFSVPIQNQPHELKFIDIKYWHLRHLPRSTTVINPKRKLELGYKASEGDIPEVFFAEKIPSTVPNPWVKYTFFEFIIALIITPLLYLKRRVVD